MNTIFDIVELAVSLARIQAGGKVQQDASVADTLLKIVRKGAEAYQAHTGQALDPSLIQAEDTI
jgi:hypothetical protein